MDLIQELRMRRSQPEEFKLDPNYSFDAPTFVDFTQPDWDDSRLEDYFNFDHENGVPVVLEDWKDRRPLADYNFNGVSSKPSRGRSLVLPKRVPVVAKDPVVREETSPSRRRSLSQPNVAVTNSVHQHRYTGILGSTAKRQPIKGLPRRILANVDENSKEPAETRREVPKKDLVKTQSFKREVAKTQPLKREVAKTQPLKREVAKTQALPELPRAQPTAPRKPAVRSVLAQQQPELKASTSRVLLKKEVSKPASKEASKPPAGKPNTVRQSRAPTRTVDGRVRLLTRSSSGSKPRSGNRSTTSSAADAEVKPFHAKPVPRGILDRAVAIKPPVKLPLTIPSSPVFHLKQRVRTALRAPALLPQDLQPMIGQPPQTGVPYKPKTEVKGTQSQPFSFYKKEMERLANREKKLSQLKEQQSIKPQQFHANPMPNLLHTSVKDKTTISVHSEAGAARKPGAQSEPATASQSARSEPVTASRSVQSEPTAGQCAQSEPVTASQSAQSEPAPASQSARSEPVTAGQSAQSEPAQQQSSGAQNYSERQSTVDQRLQQMMKEMQMPSTSKRTTAGNVKTFIPGKDTKHIVFCENIPEEPEPSTSQPAHHPTVARPPIHPANIQKVRDIRKQMVPKAHPIRQYKPVGARPSVLPSTKPHSPKFSARWANRSRTISN